MGRLGRAALVIVGAVGLSAAVVVLRGDVEPAAPPVVGPDGERIAAYQDSKRVSFTPPQDVEPAPPTGLRTDAGRRQVLVSWMPAPLGFEVRWARTDGPGPSGERAVTSAATSITDLDPGTYRVEVRSVDDAGRRSDASTAEVRVGDERPRWEQGLGFLADFTDKAASTGLDADRWRGLAEGAQCVRREGVGGPLVLSADCFRGSLRPTSPLVLSDPDPSGVRGRVVVVADVPGGVPDEPGQHELLVGVGTHSVASAEQVTLTVRAGSAAVSVDPTRVWSGAPPHALTLPVVTAPGVFHRWELVFTTDELRVTQNDRLVGSVPFRPSWTEADVDVALNSGRPSEFGGAATVRLQQIGFTGPGPDGRATEVLRLSPGVVRSEVPESRFTYRATPTAESGRIVGTVFANSGGVDGNLGSTQPPLIGVTVGGRPVEVRAATATIRFGRGYDFVADVPVDLVRAGGTIEVTAVDSSPVSLVEVELEIVHRPGADVPATTVGSADPAPLSLPRPRLRVSRAGTDVASGTPVAAGSFDVEVDVPAVAGAVAAVGWVAVRVELDGKPILVLPTGADGPAFTSAGLRFTLHVDDLPDSYRRLGITLVPARSGVNPTKAETTLRLIG